MQVQFFPAGGIPLDGENVHTSSKNNYSLNGIIFPLTRGFLLILSGFLWLREGDSSGGVFLASLQ